MKKIILILLLCVFSGATVSAQDFLRFGAKAGLNFNNMNSESFRDTKPRMGFQVGLLAEIHLVNNFSVQPEILYSSQRTMAEVEMTGSGPVPVEYRLDYIQVPVLGKFLLYPQFSLELGPSFNLLINDEGLRSNGFETILEEDFGSSFELAGLIGFTYEFGRMFFTSVRYSHGFTNAFNEEDHNTVVKNNGFRFSFGLMF